MSFGQRNKKNDSGRAVDNHGVAVDSEGGTASEKESDLNATYQKYGRIPLKFVNRSPREPDR